MKNRKILKRNYNKAISMFLVMLTVLGVSPIHVFSQPTTLDTETTILFNGEEIEMREDGSFYISKDFSMIEPPENTVTITQNYIELPAPIVTTVPLATTLARNNIGCVYRVGGVRFPNLP